MLSPQDIQALSTTLGLTPAAKGQRSGRCPVGGVGHALTLSPDGRATCTENHTHEQIEQAWHHLQGLPSDDDEADWQGAVAEYAVDHGNFSAAAEALGKIPVATPIRILAEAVPGQEPDLTINRSNDFHEICNRLRSPRCRDLLLGGTGELRWDLLKNDLVQTDPMAPNGYRVLVEAETVGAVRDRAGCTLFDEKQKPARWGPDDIKMALARVGRESKFHPVHEWLETLHCDSENTGQIEYVARHCLHLETPVDLQLFERFLIAAVARAYRPAEESPDDAQTRAGVKQREAKVDSVLVLQSDKMGRRKGLFLEALAGQWYEVVHVDPTDKDTHMNLRGVWIGEWAELTFHSIKETESLNSYLTAARDKYRAPYAPSSEAHPRRFVLAATTNKWDFLRDQSGQFRRWWPLRLGELRIDVDLLNKMRDSVWAEAVYLYKLGRRWWFEPEEESALAPTHQRFRDRDVWEPAIREGLIGRSDVRVDELLTEVVKMDMERQDKGSQKRVESSFRGMGWAAEGASWRKM